MDSIINSFITKKTLNPDFWSNTNQDDFSKIKLDTEIRKGLLNIAKEFIDSFNLPELEIEDVLFVGSLTNYNWSKYSDVDLHVVVDKSKLGDNPEIIDELFDAKKQIFNLKHNIKIKNYDIELYGQDINEKLESSKGMYSVLFAKWLQTPNKEDNSFDKNKIIKKVKEFNITLNNIKNMEDGQEKTNKLDQLKDKIKKYRKEGLGKSGEFSTENLVFKYLRRSGFIEELVNLKYQVKDNIHSIEETEF